MKNNNRGLTTVALIAVVVIAMLTAGTYAYTKVRKNGDLADALISSAKLSLERSSRSVDEIAAELSAKRLNLKKEINRLDLFNRSAFDLSSAYGRALSSIRAEVSDSVITKTDSIFNLLVNADIDTALKVSLTQNRQELIALVEEWQKTMVSNQGSVNQSKVSEASSAVVTAAEEYAQSLEIAVQNLSPENSGLTQTEIQQQQSVVDTVSNTVQQISENIDQVQPSQENIQNLEQNIQNLEQELQTTILTTPPTSTDNNPAQQTGTTSPDNGSYTPPPYIPPPPPDTSGKPQLIQGENAY